ncbi:MAG TPA: permease-like cell division protein FtsX [Candidatus Saccharimonadaceae bacterium]|nr:permease-like cell division protein FtsX [Candidatus Saccharimonadaceae bacterium]
MAKNKLDARAFAQNKRKRRQWLTFVRMCRYGINNFSRNAWLTVAATAVMTITLLIIMVTFVARQVLSDTVTATRAKVDMSIYLKTNTSNSDIKTILSGVRHLSTVTSAEYISPDQARQNFAESHSADASTLNALNESANVFPATIRVKLVDINNTIQLQNYVNHTQVVQNDLDPNNPPSYSGPLKNSITTIAHWTDMAQTLGTVISVVFVVISSLIVFNTIRMAIFNRRDEIQMMKLIGADRNFIRGPFVVESIVYGFIAAIIASTIGIGLLYMSESKLAGAGVAVDNTIHMFTTYFAVVLLAMIIVGAVIGVISSLLATRRYLKI